MVAEELIYKGRSIRETESGRSSGEFYYRCLNFLGNTLFSVKFLPTEVTESKNITENFHFYSIRYMSVCPRLFLMICCGVACAGFVCRRLRVTRMISTPNSAT